MEAHKSLPHIKTPDEIQDDLTPFRAEAGAVLYNKYCGSCHMGNGKGDGSRFPPIAGSEWVTGDQARLIDVVISGLSGPIEVNGKAFDGVMPPVDYLGDEEIAQILTYIRKEFGDNSPPVGSYYVKQGRYFSKKRKEEEKKNL